MHMLKALVRAVCEMACGWRVPSLTMLFVRSTRIGIIDVRVAKPAFDGVRIVQRGTCPSQS